MRIHSHLRIRKFLFRFGFSRWQECWSDGLVFPNFKFNSMDIFHPREAAIRHQVRESGKFRWHDGLDNFFSLGGGEARIRESFRLFDDFPLSEFVTPVFCVLEASFPENDLAGKSRKKGLCSQNSISRFKLGNALDRPRHAQAKLPSPGIRILEVCDLSQAIQFVRDNPYSAVEIGGRSRTSFTTIPIQPPIKGERRDI